MDSGWSIIDCGTGSLWEEPHNKSEQQWNTCKGEHTPNCEANDSASVASTAATLTMPVRALADSSQAVVTRRQRDIDRCRTSKKKQHNRSRMHTWNQILAVPAPRCVEFYQPNLKHGLHLVCFNPYRNIPHRQLRILLHQPKLLT